MKQNTYCKKHASKMNYPFVKHNLFTSISKVFCRTILLHSWNLCMWLVLVLELRYSNNNFPRDRKYFVKTVSKRDDGGRRLNKFPRLCDVKYGRPVNKKMRIWLTAT